MSYKIGSLFDGSGGFPLAGAMCGFVPTWAAEVEPYPIAVTRSRFPNMRHLGDVSKLNGADIEPVDIICGGSPCQDLSVAGKRCGLKHIENGDEETTRSGLFMEMVRIIKEMRNETNGEYPTFVIWENVLGAFSSNNGNDFRLVLEEFIKIAEPKAVMPAVPKGGWAYADCYCGDGWSLAYRVFDAQYWGVPQRRRRIHLVLDLRGERAGKILFEREGLRGCFTEGRTPWQAAAGDASGGSGADDRAGEGFDGYNGDLTRAASATLGVNCGVSTGRNGVIERIGGLDAVKVYGIDHAITTGGNCTAQGPCIYEDIQATLKASGPHSVAYAVPYTLKIRSGCEGGGKGPLIQTDKSATLSCNNDQTLFEPCSWDGGQISPTLTKQNAGGGQRMPDKDNFNCILQPFGICSKDSNAMKSSNPHSGIYEADTSRTIDTSGGNPACNQGGIAVVAIEGNGSRPSHRGDGFKESDAMYTLNSVEQHAVAYSMTMGSFPNVAKDKVPPLLARDFKDATVVTEPSFGIGRDAFNQGANAQYRPAIERELQPTIVAKEPGAVAQDEAGYNVRRLTPTECARLQGFPDNWGHPDHKENFTDEEYRFWLNVRNTHATINGKVARDYTEAQMLTWYNKLHTDSAEYKMWGNGIALPPALYCMQGIQDALERMETKKC